MIIADKAQHKILAFPYKESLFKDQTRGESDDFPNIMGSQSVLTKVLTIAIDGIVTLAKHRKIR